MPMIGDRAAAAIAGVGCRGSTSPLNGVPFLRKRAYLLESICSSLICINAQIGIRYYRLFLSAKFNSTQTRVQWPSQPHETYETILIISHQQFIYYHYSLLLLFGAVVSAFSLFLALHNRFALPRCFSTTIMIFSKD